MPHWVDWSEYVEMTDEERKDVTVVTFTGVDSNDSLGAAPEGGSNEQGPQDSELRSKRK